MIQHTDIITVQANELTVEAADAHEWLQRYRQRINCTVSRIPFRESGQWYFDADESALRHVSGKFFAIRGYQGISPLKPTFYQPLVDQPEIGTQGFLYRHSGTDRQVLVQARTEPGNVGLVQVGPSIQATYSNYTRIHGGKLPRFLNYFHDPAKHRARVLLDTVQPELGSKFFRKWNRNIAVAVPEDFEFSDEMFRWVSLRGLAELMQLDQVVNNDARLVFGLMALEGGAPFYRESRSPWGKAVHQSFKAPWSKSFADADEACHWLEEKRSQDSPNVRQVPLNELPNWRIKEDEIAHHDGRYFSIVQVKVHAEDREVTDWDQPLIAAQHRCNNILMCKEEHGALQMLFRTEAQIGGANGAELQPTICFDNEPDHVLPPQIAQLLEAESEARLLFESCDEGGRFHQCVNRYDIRRLPASVDPTLPDDYCWLTLHQVRSLIKWSDFMSDESRSIVSLLLAAAYCD